MARKSRWQQFSDNFNSVYDTVTDAAQGIETARVMNDKRFTGEGGLGAGLEGSALEAARYRALSDIQSKYGDVKGALETRNSYESLRNSARENVIGDATQDDVIFQRGAGASGLLRSQTEAQTASAANSYASARNSDNLVLDRDLRRPGVLENQLLINAGLGLDNTGKGIGIDKDALQLRLDQEAYNSDLRLREIAVDQALSTVDATRAGAGLSVAKTGEITTLLPGRVAEQLTGIGLQEAQTNRIEELLDGEKALQGQQLLTAIANMNLTEVQMNAIIARLPGEIAQTDAQTASIVADTTGRTLQNNELQAAADLRNMEAGFLRQVSSPEYWKSVGVEGDPTPQQRQNALIEMYQNSNVPLERQMAVEGALNAHGIEQLQNVALEITQQAKNALQTGGTEGVLSYYDTIDDGNETQLNPVTTEDGIQIVRSGEGVPDQVVFSGANDAEIQAQIMAQLTDPGTGMEIAAAMLDMRQKAAAIDETTARTGLIDIQTFTETFAADAVQARTNLVNAQTDQVRQEIDSAKGGLTVSRRIAEEGLAALMRSEAYLYMGDGENGLAQQAAAVAQYRRTMGMEPAPPTQEELDAMTPENRALFE